MTARRPLLLLVGIAAACADPGPDSPPSPYYPAPCNGTRLPAPTNPIVCPDRVIRYDEAAAGAPGAPRCVPFMGTPCRCANGAQGVDTCSTFGQPSGCFCDLPSAPGDIEGMGAPPPPLPPRLVAPLSGMRATSMRPTFRWVLPSGVNRARVELCDDRPCTRTRTTAEVAGGAWRPPEPLRPGVVFWRVTGSSNAGMAVWSSPTWEAGIPYRDTPVDSVNGPIRDVNGDSVDDIVIATHHLDSDFYMLHDLQFVPGYVGAIHGRAPAWVHLDREFRPDASDVILADLNGDGIADITTVTASGKIGLGRTEHRSPVTKVLFGGHGCPFSTSAEVVPPLSSDIAPEVGSAGDFDGDGYVDLALATGQSVMLFRGSSMGPSRTPVDAVRVPYASHKRGFQVLGDANGDGYADIAVSNVAANDGDGEVRILYGNPRGRLDERVQVIRPHGGEFGTTLAAADFTGDGRADLVVGSYGGFDLLIGGPSGMRLRQSIVVPEPTRAVPEFNAISGDFDGDGLPELQVPRGAYVYRPLVYRSLGASGFMPSPVSHGLVSEHIGVNVVGSPGDINGDGFDDLVGFEPSGSRVGIVSVHLGGSIVMCGPVQVWSFTDYLSIPET